MNKLVLIVLLLSCKAYSQASVKKIDLYVCRFIASPSAIRPGEVTHYADVHVSIRSSLLEPDTEEITRILSALSDRDTVAISEDYRIKCVIKEKFGKTETLYFNAMGSFLFNNKTYHSDDLKKIIFSFVPEILK